MITMTTMMTIMKVIAA